MYKIKNQISDVNSVVFATDEMEMDNQLILSNNNKGNQKVVCLIYDEVAIYGTNNIAHYIGAMSSSEEETKSFCNIFKEFIIKTFSHKGKMKKTYYQLYNILRNEYGVDPVFLPKFV